MIDLHCHILPGIDDGAADMHEAMAMARIAVEDGITTMVATPHIRGNHLLPGEEVFSRVEQLQGLLQQQGIALRILAGGEVSSLAPLDDCAQYGLAGSRYVLLEFPHHMLPSNAGEMIFTLRHQGLFPVIAHPERNDAVIDDPERLLALRKPGVLTQITAASLTGELGPDARRCALHLLRLGAVDVLASDSHSASRRAPRLREGVKQAAKVVGQRRADEMVIWNPQRILHDQPL